MPREACIPCQAQFDRAGELEMTKGEEDGRLPSNQILACLALNAGDAISVAVLLGGSILMVLQSFGTFVVRQ